MAKNNLFNRIATKVKKKPDDVCRETGILMGIGAICALPFDMGVSLVLTTLLAGSIPSAAILHNWSERKDENTAGQNYAAPEWAVLALKKAQEDILSIYKNVNDETERDAKVKAVLTDKKVQKALGKVQILGEKGEPIRKAEFKFASRLRKVETQVVKQIVQEQEILGETKIEKSKTQAFGL